MNNIDFKDVKVGKIVYYISRHKEKISKNSEQGIVHNVRGNLIYVRYTNGDTAALTDIQDLYVK